MINNAIARRYAKALVQLGSESGLIDRFSQDLGQIASVFGSSYELGAAFGNPALTIGQKQQIMQDLVAKFGCNEFVANFLLLLVDKHRVGCLPQIIEAYGKLADEQLGVIRPVITSAFPLSDAQIAAIKEAMEKQTGKKAVLEVNVDESLISGMVTQIGDIEYDSSAKTQLARIHDILQKG